MLKTRSDLKTSRRTISCFWQREKNWGVDGGTQEGLAAVRKDGATCSALTKKKTKCPSPPPPDNWKRINFYLGRKVNLFLITLSRPER